MSVSAISGIIATFLMIESYMSPDTTVKTVALVAASNSSILNRTNTLFSHGYGYDEVESCLSDRCSRFTDRVSPTIQHMREDQSSLGWTHR